MQDRLAMNEFGDLQVSLHDSGVALVTLDRPAVRNALRTATLAEIVDVLDAVAADEGIGAVVIAVAFSLGALGVYRLATKQCPRCRERLGKWTQVCPFCGKPQRRKGSRR